jgi:hypothetical protein
MPFTPPLYSDFGKSFNDLSTKQMKDEDFVTKLTVKRNAANGLKIETSATSNTKLDGSVKIAYKCPTSKNEFEASDNTTGKLKVKAKITDLAEGVVVTVEPSVSKSLFAAKTTVDYKQDSFCGSAVVNVNETKDKEGKNGWKHDVALSGAVGMEGISLGAKFNFEGSKCTDCNMGFNFAEDDFQFTMITETDNAKPVVRVKFFQQVNANLQSGFQYDSPSNVITLACQKKLDNVTTFKAAVNTQGLVNAALQHKLCNTAGQVNLAAQFKTTNGMSLGKMDKYGINWTLGDL